MLPLRRELKRRNVHRMAGLYLVAAWLIVQVAETIFPLFGYAETPARISVIVLAIGLVPALVFSWVYEITSEGLKRESEIDRTLSITPQTGRSGELGLWWPNSRSSNGVAHPYALGVSKPNLGRKRVRWRVGFDVRKPKIRNGFRKPKSERRPNLCGEAPVMLGGMIATNTDGLAL